MKAVIHRILPAIALTLACLVGSERKLGAQAPAGAPGTVPAPAEPASVGGAGAAFEPFVVWWLPERVPEGTLFEVRVQPGAGPIGGATGTFAGEPLHFGALPSGEFVALAAVPVGSSGEIELALEVRSAGQAARGVRRSVAVLPGDYEMERLSVAPEFGDPYPPEIQRRIDEEAARAAAVSRASHDTPRMWETPFVQPRESRITSGFGGGRIFNDQVTSRHTGTDFAGAVGAPVVAPARGVVALVAELFLGGNAIYVDHGAGLVTAYLHLSEQLVEEGDVVEPGQLIGRVGATGRVTGPHLHWIVRYGTISVDAMSLLALR